MSVSIVQDRPVSQIVVRNGIRIELLPGEEIQKIVPVGARNFAALPDPVAELRRITATEPGFEIGAKNPAVASLTKISSASSKEKAYEVVFGRDSLKIATRAIFVAPALMPTTLLYLGRRQGLPRGAAPEPDKYDARREEPGRIVHEVRDPAVDVRAQEITREWGWAWPNYNTDDAALLFVRELARRAGEDSSLLQQKVVQRDGVTRSMSDILLKTLEWAESRCNNREGLLESRRAPSLVPGRIELSAYPVWMDSAEAAHRDDGTLCSGPMAWIELQAQYYDALVATARLAESGLLAGADPAALRGRAYRLQSAVRKHFVTRDRKGRPLVAYATERVEGKIQTLRTLRSNPAAALDSEMFDGVRMRPMVAAILEQTFNPSRGLICPSGIRTLAKGEARFRPDSYHCGSVWPHDNHDIACGVARHGALALAVRTDQTMRNVFKRLRHFPELIRGSDDAEPSESPAWVWVKGSDPHFGEYSCMAMEPGQDNQGWAIASEIDARVRLLAFGSAVKPSTELEKKLIGAGQRMIAAARRRRPEMMIA